MNIEKMNNMNRQLERLMPFMTPAGVLIALVFGHIFIPLKPLVNILFGLMTFFGAMKISLKDMKESFHHPVFIAAYAAASFLIMPIIAEGISLILFRSNRIIGAGYNMVRAVPTAVVGSVWATMFHGNITVSLAVLLLDAILAPVITPLMLNLFTGTVIEIDTFSMMKSLCFMVVIPFILGLIFNHFFNHEIKEYIGPISNPISKILFFLEIIINVSQVSERIVQSISWKYLLAIVASIVLSASGFAVGHIISRAFRLGRKEDISITFAVALRNTNAALVLAIGFLPEVAAFPIILSIVIQQTLASVIGRILFRTSQ